MEKRRQTKPRQNRVYAGRKRRAATRDIVGSAVETARVPEKWRHQYDRLIELRDHFTRRQTDLTHDAIEEQPAFSSHMADAATDTYDRDFALGILSSEQDAVYQIESALDRIRNGTYGICELTGKPIERARLEAIPWTRFSAAAEKQLEQEGALKHASLGARQSVARESTANESADELQ